MMSAMYNSMGFAPCGNRISISNLNLNISYVYIIHHVPMVVNSNSIFFYFFIIEYLLTFIEDSGIIKLKY